MALYPHIAFGFDESGQIVSAGERLAILPTKYRCIGCGTSLTIQGGHKAPAYFAHANLVECLQGPQLALRAAALKILSESRFICAPSLNSAAGGARKVARASPLVEEWNESTTDWIVDGVKVDMFVQSMAGSLVICIAIPGLFEAAHRERVRSLKLPALEVAIAKTTRIHTFNDLRDVVLKSVTNKQWLYHPVLSPELTPLEKKLHWDLEPALLESQPGPSRTSVPVQTGSWVHTGALADSLRYNQLSVTHKIEVLEASLGCRSDKWPEELDIHVKGDASFNCDRRLWQADLFSRFVRGAERHSVEGRFDSGMVLRWLEPRYGVQPPFENAEKVAIYLYLEELSSRGFLHRLGRQRYQVVKREWQPHSDRLAWNPRANLSASTLRNLSSQAGLRIPVDLVQMLLETFDDCHPAGTVEEFSARLANELHAPARTVVAFLLDAGLVHRSSKENEARQGRLL